MMEGEAVVLYLQNDLMYLRFGTKGNESGLLCGITAQHFLKQCGDLLKTIATFQSSENH